jgi:hypothetical protein
LVPVLGCTTSKAANSTTNAKASKLSSPQPKTKGTGAVSIVADERQRFRYENVSIELYLCENISMWSPSAHRVLGWTKQQQSGAVPCLVLHATLGSVSTLGRIAKDRLGQEQVQVQVRSASSDFDSGSRVGGGGNAAWRDRGSGAAAAAASSWEEAGARARAGRRWELDSSDEVLRHLHRARGASSNPPVCLVPRYCPSLVDCLQSMRINRQHSELQEQQLLQPQLRQQGFDNNRGQQEMKERDNNKGGVDSNKLRLKMSDLELYGPLGSDENSNIGEAESTEQAKRNNLDWSCNVTVEDLQLTPVSLNFVFVCLVSLLFRFLHFYYNLLFSSLLRVQDLLDIYVDRRIVVRVFCYAFGLFVE